MIQSLFPVDIYKTKFDDLENIQQVLESKALTENFASDRPIYKDLFTSVSSTLFSWRETFGAEKLHETEPLRKIKKFIEHHAKIYWDHLGYWEGVDPKIYQSGITKYHHGGTISKHNHISSMLAGVFYLHASPEQGNLVFEHPLEMWLGTQPYKDKSVNMFQHEIPVHTGDLVLFPGYLKHFTLPNMTHEDRIMMFVNINTTGEYKNPHVGDQY